MISFETVIMIALTVLYTILQEVCISIYFKSFMLCRIKPTTFYLIGFILMGLLKLLPNGMGSNTKLLLTMFFILIYVFISFYGTIIQKLYHILFFTLIELLVDLSLFLITNRLFSDDVITRLAYFFANFISIFFLIFIVKMIKTFNASQTLELKNREYLLLTIIPLLSILSTCFVKNLDDLGQFVSCLFLFIVNICTMIIFSDLIKREAILHNYSLIETQNRYYKESLKSQKGFQQTKHDLKNMLIHFSYQLDHQQVNNVKKQLKEILNTTLFLDSKLTGYMPLDAILANKIEEIKENNIAYKIDVQIPSDFSFNDEIDLVAILGNILDNAIEAVLRLKEPLFKEIKIYIKYDKNKLYICVENTSNQINVYNNKAGLISEKRTQGFGVGISSIKSRVNKLNGYYDFTYDSGVFSVIVVLPIAYKSDV